jgi:hypothetical protein
VPQSLPRPLAAATFGIALVATSGCGPLLPEAQSQPLFPGVEAAVHRSQGRVEPPDVVRLNFRAGEPTDVFGRRAVAQGYAEAVWFAAATTFAAQTLLPGPWQNEGAFTRHSSRMTADMARENQETVRDCFDGNVDACDLMYAWRFNYVEDDAYQLRTRGPVLVHHVIHEAGVWVDRSSGEPQLAVRFEQRGDLRVRQDGENVLVPLVKDATYWLVPAPEGTSYSWQIDDIDVSWVELDPVPDTGTD